jgi:RIO kinase 1
MVNPLEPLLADGVIDEVLSRLKSGKEADLWLVRHGEDVLAAKVYKAREGRSFKNNSAYLEGRRVRNSRTQRAMDRGSRFGQAAAEEAWKTKEADALHALHAAGVWVPRPVLFYEGVLLMEVVVDAAGHPAPRLIDAEVPVEQAAGLYAGLRSQVVKMLCCDLVHGDLSPYNVLLGRNGPVIIDFPQVVGAAHNSQAEGFFFRDLANLRHYFEAIDPALRSAAGDGREIWRAYVRRELTPDFVPSPSSPEAAGPQSRPLQRPQRPPNQGRSQPQRPQQQPRSQQPPSQPHQQRSPKQERSQGPRPQQQARSQPLQPQPQHQQRSQPQRSRQQPVQDQPARPQRPPVQPQPLQQQRSANGRSGPARQAQGGRARQARPDPIVQRVPVLGAPSAPRPAQPPEPAGAAPTSQGQGRRRRRRGHR